MDRLKRFKIRLPRRTRYRRPLLIFLGMVAWCCVVLPVFFTYRDEGMKGGSHFEYQTSSTELESGIKLSFNLLSMDAASRKADFLVEADPFGDYKTSDNKLAKPIDLNLRYKVKKYNTSTIIEPFIVSFPFVYGNLRDYPLETFESYFPVDVTSTYIINKQGDKIVESVPLEITMDAISQLFKIRFNLATATNELGQLDLLPNTLLFKITMKRPPTTILVCTFMGILMWALSCSMINIVWDALLYNREIPPPLLSVGIAMLFALPALRNSQPGVPAMGCLADILGFFWNLVLISICSIALIYNWALKWKRPSSNGTIVKAPAPAHVASPYDLLHKPELDSEYDLELKPTHTYSSSNPFVTNNGDPDLTLRKADPIHKNMI